MRGGGSIIYNWLARHLDILHAGAATLQFGSTAAPPPSKSLFSKTEIKSKKELLLETECRRTKQMQLKFT
jgi:hypothetical protein